MTVQANTSWQDTDITVSRGETVKITYVCGRWCSWTRFCMDGRGCINVDPAVCSPNPDAPANLISALHASLIARIGENPTFPVGNALTFQAAHSGQLQLRINDVRVEDNSGAIVVLGATQAHARRITPSHHHLQVEHWTHTAIMMGHEALSGSFRRA